MVAIESVAEADQLRDVRTRADYSLAERRFSRILQARLGDLLQGRRNWLGLLRKYPGHDDRLGVALLPPGIARDELRLAVVERLGWDVLGSVRADTIGGPIAQSLAADGSVIETQTFATRYPHIIIERIDRFPPGHDQSDEITWALRRVQNQRAAVRFNRLLDMTNLVIEVLRLVR
jgi:hypothetical protein